LVESTHELFSYLYSTLLFKLYLMNTETPKITSVGIDFYPLNFGRSRSETQIDVDLLRNSPKSAFVK
jgi:hypothetical protein